MKVMSCVRPILKPSCPIEDITRSVDNSKYDVADGQRVNCTARHCRQVTLAVCHSPTDATVSNPDSFLKISFHRSSSLEIDLGGADFLTQRRATPGRRRSSGPFTLLALTPRPHRPVQGAPTRRRRRRWQPEASVLTWQLLASRIFFFIYPPTPR